MKGIIYREKYGVRYINTTPHPIRFRDSEGDWELPPSGILINARPVEEQVPSPHPQFAGLIFVQTRFVGDPESEKALTRLEREYGPCLIIGSIIAAQAYPGRVAAMTPVPGYERVPVQEKRMHPLKFTIFA
jgi:hypothetical protein